MNEIELKLRENRRKRMEEEKKLHEAQVEIPDENDPELEEIPGGISGYYMFRKRDKVTGKGKWWVKPYDPRLGDTNKMYPITYKQALGEEPISLKEYAWDDEDEDTGEHKKLRSKSVLDSDGFYTDYTMYLCNGQYVCILGDNEAYTPENTEPDAEFDDESEAIEWFDNYEGFADEYDESKKTSIRAEHAPMSTATKPQINEAFVESEAILQGLTKVRTEAREAHSKYVNMNDLAECKAILTYLVKDSKALLDLVTDALNGNSVDESKMTESKWGIETDILDDIEAIVLGKKSVNNSILKDAEFMIGAGGEGMIYLPDVDTFDIKVSPRGGAVKIENKETQINEDISGASLTLEDLKNATYSSSFMKDRAWVTVDGRRYVKIGPDKWEYQPLQAKAIGGTYSSEQLLDEVNNAEKVDYELYLKPVNEASWDDEEDEDYDDFDDESDVRASNWRRLKDLQGDFWTNLDELVEDIEDKLGYEVVFKSREYLSIIDPDAEDDEEYKLTLGGTERTIVVELDSSYPM